MCTREAILIWNERRTYSIHVQTRIAWIGDEIEWERVLWRKGMEGNEWQQKHKTNTLLEKVRCFPESIRHINSTNHKIYILYCISALEQSNMRTTTVFYIFYLFVCLFQSFLFGFSRRIVHREEEKWRWFA